MDSDHHSDALDLRWAKVRTQLEAVAHLLETLGYVECQTQAGKPFWCVRFVELRNGARKRRTIYVGKSATSVWDNKIMLWDASNARNLPHWKSTTTELTKSVSAPTAHG